MSKNHCKTDPNRFCYACGTLSFKGELRGLSASFISLYHAYFKRDVCNQGSSYVPRGVCGSCNTSLRAWSTGARKSMPFGSPMIWSESLNHPEDCYFCNCPTEGYNRKNHKEIEYPDFTSSKRPLAHGPDLPIPRAPWSDKKDIEEDCDSGTEMVEFVDQVECLEASSMNLTSPDPN
ncbi:hypothetical protein QAD02_013188 [Eretmocerus hayati]|uniref:Uncharacterized protein n=1 Tax=Eretmocerus hayati TaxID=131215 RepID=A0ACC2P2W4_9HYME|nr:hypothetical protein QAD02_013188 [Eretmocerus hayati]